MKIETQSVRSSRSLTSRLAALVAIAIVSAWGAGSAWAKDSVKVSVTNASEAPVIVENGQAQGTIQLFYTVKADSFTLGPFATFDLNWETILGKPATDYGDGVSFKLVQDQQGGFVDLVPDAPEFTLRAPGQSGTSTITVHIGPKKGSLPPSTDGTELVGNLKLDADSKVGSVTSVQVHILLVHPTDCLKLYNSVTDMDFNGIASASVKVGKNGISSNPGQFSNNVWIVNTCASDHSFDLLIGLDERFSTHPNGNPGNAVFTYAAAGELDSSEFNTLRTAGGTPHQQNLCLQNVRVPAHTSFLATVHSGLRDNLTGTQLLSATSFDFAATLHDNTSYGKCEGSRYSDASPNPATFSLPFTIK